MHHLPGIVQEPDGLDCPYRQASEAQLLEFLQLCTSDRDAAADLVATVLGQGNHKQDTRQQLHVTFTTLALRFAQERQFSGAKVGVVFNITQTLLASVCQGDSREECEAGVVHLHAFAMPEHVLTPATLKAAVKLVAFRLRRRVCDLVGMRYGCHCGISALVC